MREKTVLAVLAIILLPVLFAGLPIAAIFALFTIPIEIPRYRKSAYFKRYRKKYFWGITRQEAYRVANYLETENIDYTRVVDENADEIGAVIGNTTVLFPWFEEMDFDDSGNCLIAEEEGDPLELLSENPKVKNRENVKVLIRKREFHKEQLDAAYHNEMLFIYEELSELKALLR